MVIILLITILGLFILTCTLLYVFQERIIFFPQKLSKGHSFQFETPFEERNIKTDDGTILNGLLFKADSANGLIFYLHGNAGSLDSWGSVAKTYTDLHYDVFLLDYRGYGKSGGTINGQKQIYADVQNAYDVMTQEYPEEKIIVLGYSIGSGLASKVASDNNPRLLILQAPYYNLTDVMQKYFSFIPTFILKYEFKTNEHLRKCKMPVIIFHGDQDEVIYYGSSLKLAAEFKDKVKVITLRGQGHNGITENRHYRMVMKQMLIR